jgi:beta-glucanase (GH16 family)
MITLRNTRCAAASAIAAAGLIAVCAAPAYASDTRKVTVTVKASASVTVSISVSRFSDVVAQVDASSPRYFTGHGTGAGSASVKRTAKAKASATVTGTGSLKALRTLAHKQALAAARQAATKAAKSHATTKARADATAAAQSAATNRAAAAALAAVPAADRSSVPQFFLVAAGDPSFKPCGGSLPKADGTQWVCTFDDEFTGTALDPRKWTVMTSDATKYSAGDSCFVDNPSNIDLSKNALHLTVRKTAPFTCSAALGRKTTTQAAANVATMNKFSQAYGRFAVRAKFPATTIAGLHAALWLWPQSYVYGMLWPLSGEIDIAEEYSVHPDRAIPYVHYVFDPATVDLASSTNVPTNNNCLVNDIDAFHEYAVEWSPKAMTITFDKKVCLVDHWSALNSALTPLQGSAPFDQPFFIALTQAVGVAGNAFDATKTPLPGTTTIDWVRVWK